jgi:hypothetical protein
LLFSGFVKNEWQEGGEPMDSTSMTGNHEAAVRRCGRCGEALTVTPEDTLYCHRCGRCVRKWMVELHGRVVGAGSVASGRHGGQVWLSRTLARLRVQDFVRRLRMPANPRSGWTQET